MDNILVPVKGELLLAIYHTLLCIGNSVRCSEGPGLAQHLRNNIGAQDLRGSLFSAGTRMMGLKVPIFDVSW